MLVLQLVLLVIIINSVICINTDENLNKLNDIDIDQDKQRRYLKKNDAAVLHTVAPTPHALLSNSVTSAPTKNEKASGNDDVVFHTLSPTPSKEYTLSPTPHALSNSTPDPTPAPTKNENAPTRAPTDPPDETNGIIVVSTVLGCFLLGVLYFQYIKPNFISKKKLELAGRGNNITTASDFDARAPEEADFGQIYGNQPEIKTTIIPSNSKESLSSNKKDTWSSNQSFDEKDPLLPPRNK